MANSATQFMHAVRINYLKTEYAKYKKKSIHLSNKYFFFTTTRQALLDAKDTSVKEIDGNACLHRDRQTNQQTGQRVKSL